MICFDKIETYFTQIIPGGFATATFDRASTGSAYVTGIENVFLS